MTAVRFADRPGGERLAYRHHGGSGPTIVFLPGYRSDMAGGKATAIFDWACGDGRACLLFDYAGCGQSDGDFVDQTLADWRDDALFLIDTLVDGPVILVGSSMGGWLMLLVALALGDRDGPDRVAGLLGIAAAPDFTDWGFSDADRQTIRRAGRLEEATPYSDDPVVTTRGFWESGQASLLLDAPVAFAGPVRLLHGQRDADVPWDLSLRLADRLRSDDVQVVLVKDGDHRLSRDRDIALLIATLARLARSIEGHPMILSGLILAAALQSTSPGIYEPAPIMIPGRDDGAGDARQATALAGDAATLACLKRASEDPDAGRSAALDWISRGGGWPARQCLGFAYSHGGDYAAATGVFARAASEADVARDERAASLWVLAGNAALASGDARTASLHFDAALARATLTGLPLGEVHVDRARARVATGDLAGAAADLARARSEAAADPLTWLLSATLARRQDDLAAATQYIAEAARIAPTDPAIMLEAGNIAILSGQVDAARRNWQGVVAAAPQSREADAARDNLSRLPVAPPETPPQSR